LLLLLLGLRALLSDPATGVAMGEVREGPFRVTIVEAGTLQALRSVSYASAIQSNQAKIVALVPEGKLVEKGDLLILFDAAPFEEEIRKSQAALEQAEAELSKARQDQGLQQIQNQEDCWPRASAPRRASWSCGT
jgi:multidrug efflux pump subunit AcrA (membrane-fusion protein)